MIIMELGYESSRKRMYTVFLVYSICAFAESREVREVLCRVGVCCMCLFLYKKPDILTQIQFGLHRKLNLLTEITDLPNLIYELISKVYHFSNQIYIKILTSYLYGTNS